MPGLKLLLIRGRAATLVLLQKIALDLWRMKISLTGWVGRPPEVPVVDDPGTRLWTAKEGGAPRQ